MAAFVSWNILSIDCRCFRCVVDGAIDLVALEVHLVLAVGFVRFVPSVWEEFEGIPWYEELVEDGVGELLPVEYAPS